MTGQRIDPVLVEKAAEAFADVFGDRGVAHQTMLKAMDAALRVVFDELGLKQEMGQNEKLEDTHVRYLSDWRPVEQGDTK